MFAKLYETQLGQILVKIDDSDSGPAVRFFFEPEGLGVCSVALQFSDSDCGWSDAESAFDRVTEEQALLVVSEVIGKLSC